MQLLNEIIVDNFAGGGGASAGIELTTVIWKDTKTGCRYLLFDTGNRAAITPLLKSNGEPDCGE